MNKDKYSKKQLSAYVILYTDGYINQQTKVKITPGFLKSTAPFLAVRCVAIHPFLPRREWPDYRCG